VTRFLVSAAALCALALAGCSGSSHHAETTKPVSLPAYGSFPATTIAGSQASARVCREDAGTFAHDALGLLAHFGPAAAYPADLNLVIVREDLARLRAHNCDPKVLGGALDRALTPAQRRALATDLPATMAREVRESLARVGQE
jgi:hypothetical protein